VALRTTCNKNVKFKIIKIKTSCQYVGCFYHSKNLNWAAQNLRLGRMRVAGWTQLVKGDTTHCAEYTMQVVMIKFCTFQIFTCRNTILYEQHCPLTPLHLFGTLQRSITTSCLDQVNSTKNSHSYFCIFLTSQVSSKL